MPLPQLVLDQFPVELIFDVFTYLTASEILHSFHNFSQYLRQCIRSYQHYKINFQSIRKREYDWICKVIHPDQIMSLTVSDDEETPGQMDLFFSNNQSFTRLEHLRLRNLEDFPNLLQMECLHTLTIDFKIRTIYSFDYNHMKRHDNALIKIFQLSNLRTLILNNEPLNMDFNFKILPITENLHTLQVHLKTIDNLSDIFICMPKLQRLDLSLKTTFSGDHHVSEFNVPRSLTHLSIEVKYGFRDEIERFIQACTMLTYLNIHIERNQSDFNQWLDGNWWQLLIEKFLPHLKIFHLRIDLIPLPELTMTKQLFESFQTIFWTDIQNKYRTFTIGLLPSDTLPVNCKQHIESSETLSIDLPHNEVSVLPSECVSNIKTLNLKHNSRTAECYILSDLCEIKPYMNDFSTLVHLKLDSECTITPFVFNQLLTMAPCLTRLTISSFPDHLHKMLDFQYPQIRWLDLRRIYISSKIRTKFCSAFPNLEHLMNCHVYSEEDLEVLIENLKYLQNITIHNQAYYFDSDNEFDQWLRKHTHLKNFTFKLINERQIQLWINN